MLPIDKSSKQFSDGIKPPSPHRETVSRSYRAEGGVWHFGALINLKRFISHQVSRNSKKKKDNMILDLFANIPIFLRCMCKAIPASFGVLFPASNFIYASIAWAYQTDSFGFSSSLALASSFCRP